ncbi:DegT/DnrJ/EryC1/StrS family aminotransferase [Paenibacillus sp. GCM10027626]|uniref:DegT/DnrJ/EryC1/StrS family aminotransferase n=1 Tax=Paenibacillus sp. GCM10027626 TaxID=3273411 RepID=UPI00364290B4
MEKLAIHGGEPLRKGPLPPNYPGAMLMGEAEAIASADVIKARSPFRYYGPDMQHAVRRLEERMCSDFGVPYSLGVTSGTAALIVALRAVGVGYGDKVIVPANTFVATPGSVICCNAVPVFADIDDTMNIDPNDLERVMDDEVKAIIAVPIIGTPCDMDPIMEFARKHNIAVIEDVAQSCGVKYKGKYQGTIGDIGAFSFQINKILTAGEGGAVMTRERSYFERALRYHDQGNIREKDLYGIDSPDDLYAFAGQNYRMSELSGAVVLEQWNKLEGIIAHMKRCWNAARSALLAELPGIRFRPSPDEDGELGSNLGIVLSSADEAKQFSDALEAENISNYILYGGNPVYNFPQIIHQRTADRDGFPFNYPFKRPVRYTAGMCPKAEDLIPRVVFIPISPVLADIDVEQIVAGIVKVYRGLQIGLG